MPKGPLHILIASDLSTRSQLAIKYAKTLSELVAVKITLFHVFEETPGTLLFYNTNRDSHIIKSIIDRLTNMAVLEGIQPSSSLQVKVVNGKIFEKINEELNTGEFQLLIMAVNSSSDPENRYIGSNTLKMMRVSTVPLMIADFQSSFNRLKRIVVPINLTLDSSEKVKRIGELNQLFPDLIFCFVHVVYDADEFAIHRNIQLFSKVKEQLAKIKVRYTSEIVRVSSSDENMSEILKDYARKMDGDAIILMPHQDGRQTPYFVSTLAQEIISITDIPAITIAPSL